MFLLLLPDLDRQRNSIDDLFPTMLFGRLVANDSVMALFQFVEDGG